MGYYCRSKKIIIDETIIKSRAGFGYTFQNQELFLQGKPCKYIKNQHISSHVPRFLDSVVHSLNMIFIRQTKHVNKNNEVKVGI